MVNVGGSFVASTLETSDRDFLAGGPLGFAGASPARVVNLGKVGALGGDVALVAAQVSNAGSISAPGGSAGLLAGRSVLMLRDGALDQGRFSVLLGGAGTSVTNTGLIAAADAELRAEGGNVYALAGDTAGVIRATGVKSGGGKVWLVADGGELDLGGAISAAGAGGPAGASETSGGGLPQHQRGRGDHLRRRWRDKPGRRQHGLRNRHGQLRLGRGRQHLGRGEHPLQPGRKRPPVRQPDQLRHAHQLQR